MLPAASRARACSVCTPFDADVVSHVMEYGAVVSSAPRLAPSSRNWTPATPTLSVAVAETVTFPETTVPAAGAVTAAPGGVVSGAAGVVAVAIVENALRLPAASTARTW